MPQITRLGALRITSPWEWKTEIEDAMKHSNGRVPEAALSLEVSVRQLFRWLALPELADVKRAPSGAPRVSKRHSHVTVSDDIPVRRKKKVA